MEKSCCEIICFGDICPTADTLTKFQQADCAGIFNDILLDIRSADIVMGNLECALTDAPEPVKKTGPVLCAPTSCIKTLKCAGFTTLGLANNHIRDCGEKGVMSTLKACSDAGIECVGAAGNLKDAKRPLIIESKGWKIGVMAFAEQEFNVAQENSPGANYLDVYDDFDAIKEFRTQVDYLIILYHGGVEYYEYPSPLLQKRCRKMVDCGARIVLCQHSHCIGTKEKYGGGEILYGQGNSIFGYKKNNDSWNSGLMVKIKLSDKTPEVEYVPIHATATGGIGFVSGKKKNSLLDEVDRKSLNFGDHEFIVRSWEGFCDEHKELYLPLVYGWSVNANRLNRLLHNKCIEGLYSKRKMNITLNLIRCEAHKEVVETILSQYRFK